MLINCNDIIYAAYRQLTIKLRHPIGPTLPIGILDISKIPMGNIVGGIQASSSARLAIPEVVDRPC